MAEPEVTTMGEKGQVVIPRALRREMGVKAKTKFAVYGQGDIIVLKRLELPDLHDDRFLELAVDGRADLVVSGDQHLLGIGSFSGVPIVKVRDAGRKLGSP